MLKSVMLIQGGRGGVPAQKFGLFVTAGGPTAASFSDRLLAHTQQAFADMFDEWGDALVCPIELEQTWHPSCLCSFSEQ